MIKISTFDLGEAKEMLQLSYAVNVLGPKTHGEDNFPVDSDGKRPLIREIGSTRQIAPVDAPNPLYKDDQSFYNYPTTVWPEGWGPAVKFDMSNAKVPSEEETVGLDLSNQWILSRVTSLLPTSFKGREGANCVLACKKEGKKKGISSYAIAFAGTANLVGGMEDILIPLVPTDPLPIGYKVLGFELPMELGGNYSIPVAPYHSEANIDGDQPKAIKPKIHFGFRLALESLLFPLSTRCPFYTLKCMLKNIELAALSNGETEIDLCITGHSLGGALAGVFTTWLLANQPFSKDIKVNLKTYTFASPKIGNDAFAYAYDIAHTNYGRSYRVANCLDSVPQVPFSIEGLAALNNPKMLTDLVDANPKLKEILELFLGYRLPLNYCHVGSSIAIPGHYPVVWEEDTWPKSWSAQERPPLKIFPDSLALVQQWWQHWPGNYADALNRLEE